MPIKLRLSQLFSDIAVKVTGLFSSAKPEKVTTHSEPQKPTPACVKDCFEPAPTPAHDLEQVAEGEGQPKKVSAHEEVATGKQASAKVVESHKAVPSSKVPVKLAAARSTFSLPNLAGLKALSKGQTPSVASPKIFIPAAAAVLQRTFGTSPLVSTAGSSGDNTQSSAAVVPPALFPQLQRIVSTQTTPIARSEAQKIVIQTLHVVTEVGASRDGQLGKLLSVFEQAKTPRDLEKANKVFETLLTLPPAGREVVYRALIKSSGSVVATLDQFVEVLTSAVASIGAHESSNAPVGENVLTVARPTTSSVLPSSPTSASAAVAYRGTVGIEGGAEGTSVVPQSVPVAALPQRVGFIPFAQIMAALPAKLAETFQAAFTAIAPRNYRGTLPTALSGNFIKQALLLETPVLKEVVKNITRAFMHDSSAVRLLVVKFLKLLAQERPELLDKQCFDVLKALARDRRDVEVRSEAIRVLVDTGSQHQGKNRQEMAALLAEIELVPFVSKLLGSRKVGDLVIGLDLLARSWEFLEPSVRQGLFEKAFERAVKTSAEPVYDRLAQIVMKDTKNIMGALRSNRLVAALRRDSLNNKGQSRFLHAA